jgi:hypothetical protein
MVYAAASDSKFPLQEVLASHNAIKVQAPFPEPVTCAQPLHGPSLTYVTAVRL